MLKITTIETTIGLLVKTAIARGIPKNPLLENSIAKRIILRFFSCFSFIVKGIVKKKNRTVKRIQEIAVITAINAKSLVNSIEKMLEN